MENISNKYIEIFKGDNIDNLKSQKVIVFDLDETIGCFMHLNIIWNKISDRIENNDHQIIFNNILDLYPEFFRTNIFNILKYLHKKKKTGECKKVFIYTNNNCSKTWCDMIVEYIHYKMGLESDYLFDNAVGSHKFDSRRCTNRKTYNDFINCSMLSNDTRIGFIDNAIHKGMKHDKVYYIKPRSYYHTTPVSEIITRFLESPVYKQISYNIENENQLLKMVNFFNSIESKETNTLNLQQIK